jgi:hypothetical protein
LSASGDKQVEMLGEFIIGFLKGVFDFLVDVSVGIRKLPENTSNFIFLAINAAIGAAIFYLRNRIVIHVPLQYRKVADIALYFPLALPLIYLYWKGQDYRNFINTFDKKFESIGFYDKGKHKTRNIKGEWNESKGYPKFIGEKKEGKKVIYSFRSNIPVSEWKARCLDLETVMDCNIIKLEHTKASKQIISLHTIPTHQGLMDFIPWSDNCVSEKDFELVVGVAMLEDVVFDLNKVPHALIAGVTGSGKSVLLRCMLWQCIKKGAKPYMIDFKGGVEFGTLYEQFGEVVTERQRALEILKELVAENTARLNKFREMGVKNLPEYNAIAEKKLCRIVIICDEIAEMLDKTGLGKADKKIYEEIEKELSTLARLSRATGINMLLATQRPDAKVIPGQIKNNLPIRISGRMVDPQASEMVLGNTKATDMDDTRGRFMYSVGADTFEFQAYAFDDKFLRKGEYKQGEMLTNFDDWDNGTDDEERVYIPCGDDSATTEECIEESDNDILPEDPAKPSSINNEEGDDELEGF